MVNGTSMEPMNIYLARQRVLDPLTTKIVSSEANLSEMMKEPDYTLSLIGMVDRLELPKKPIHLWAELESQREPKGLKIDIASGPFNYDSLDPAGKQIRLLSFGQQGVEGIVHNLKLETLIWRQHLPSIA